MAKTWGREIWEKKSKNQKGITVSRGVMGRIQGKKNYHKIMDGIQNELSKFLNRHPIKNVLEVGPGPDAINAKFFRDRGYGLDLVDVSPNTIKLAREKLKDDGIGYFCQDMTELKIPNKYSLIFCYGTFLHVPSSLAMVVLNNFYKHLKKGGYLIVDFPVKRDMTVGRKSFELVYYLGHRLKTMVTGMNFYVTCAEYAREELEEIFRRTNFKLTGKRGNKNDLWILKK